MNIFFPDSDVILTRRHGNPSPQLPWPHSPLVGCGEAVEYLESLLEEREYSIAAGVWSVVITLAASWGWRPLGTSLRGDRQWTGAYQPAAGQHMGHQDVAAFRDALKRALDAGDLQLGPWHGSGGDAGALNEWIDDDDFTFVVVEVAWFCAGGGCLDLRRRGGAHHGTRGVGAQDSFGLIQTSET